MQGEGCPSVANARICFPYPYLPPPSSLLLSHDYACSWAFVFRTPTPNPILITTLVHGPSSNPCDLARPLPCLAGQQPSPNWSTCGVTGIKVWGDDPSSSISQSSTSSKTAGGGDVGAGAVASQVVKTKAVSALIETLSVSCMDLKKGNASFGIKLKR